MDLTFKSMQKVVKEERGEKREESVEIFFTKRCDKVVSRGLWGDGIASSGRKFTNLHSCKWSKERTK